MLGMHSGLLMMLWGLNGLEYLLDAFAFAYDALGFEMGLGMHGMHSLRL